MSTTKSFDISKQVVWEAYKKVKENKGAAGVDEESIKDFEKNLKDNLYKIWNRMSSGSYIPSANGEDSESERRRKNAGDTDGCQDGVAQLPGWMARIVPEAREDQIFR